MKNLAKKVSAEEDDEYRFGEKVKAIRSRKKLSLRDLAERTGLSVGMLSQIERGVTNPSLKTLTKLRVGLGIPLSAFFDDEGASAPGAFHSVVRRRAARPTLDIGEGILKVLLSPATAVDLQVMMLVIEPGGGTKDTVVGVPGEKACVVIKGTVSIILDEERYILEEGDTIQFNAETPHVIHNPGRVQAQMTWIINQRPKERHI
jgi:transcriptional regulator with XRE-family HTH domain